MTEHWRGSLYSEENKLAAADAIGLVTSEWLNNLSETHICCHTLLEA
jgi:hypothetical protein